MDTVTDSPFISDVKFVATVKDLVLAYLQEFDLHCIIWEKDIKVKKCYHSYLGKYFFKYKTEQLIYWSTLYILLETSNCDPQQWNNYSLGLL